jgi:hypothetical protein
VEFKKTIHKSETWVKKRMNTTVISKVDTLHLLQQSERQCSVFSLNVYPKTRFRVHIG